MAGIKWRKTYEAVLATPLGVGDIIGGHLGWIAIRLTFGSLPPARGSRSFSTSS